jgi:hypothetical protein
MMNSNGQAHGSSRSPIQQQQPPQFTMFNNPNWHLQQQQQQQQQFASYHPQFSHLQQQQSQQVQHQQFPRPPLLTTEMFVASNQFPYQHLGPIASVANNIPPHSRQQQQQQQQIMRGPTMPNTSVASGSLSNTGPSGIGIGSSSSGCKRK